MSRHKVPLFAALLVLAACSREPIPSPSGTFPAAGPPVLVDAATQTWRFEDGDCRSLSKLPAPWRVQPDDFGRLAVSAEQIRVEADTSAFGIPGPARHRQGGKDQRRIRATLGAHGTIPNPGPTDLSIDNSWMMLRGSMQVGEETAARWSLPKGFQAFRDPQVDQDIVYLDTTRRAIVTDNGVEEMPNGWIDGVIWISERDASSLRIPYEAIPFLDVIVDQIRALPGMLRVPCPANVPPAPLPQAPLP